MRYRFYLLLVTAFFLTMNVLLWRSEFGSRGHLGAPVPADFVWEKVLTSPDHSSLEIRHHGVKIGRAQWAASIGEDARVSVWLLALATLFMLAGFVLIEPCMHWLLHGQQHLLLKMGRPDWAALLLHDHYGFGLLVPGPTPFWGIVFPLVIAGTCVPVETPL